MAAGACTCTLPGRLRTRPTERNNQYQTKQSGLHPHRLRLAETCRSQVGRRDTGPGALAALHDMSSKWGFLGAYTMDLYRRSCYATHGSPATTLRGHVEDAKDPLRGCRSQVGRRDTGPGALAALHDMSSKWGFLGAYTMDLYRRSCYATHGSPATTLRGRLRTKGSQPKHSRVREYQTKQSGLHPQWLGRVDPHDAEDRAHQPRPRLRAVQRAVYGRAPHLAL